MKMWIVGDHHTTMLILQRGSVFKWNWLCTINCDCAVSLKLWDIHMHDVAIRDTIIVWYEKEMAIILFFTIGPITYMSFSKIHEFSILMEHLKFHSFYHRYVQIILFLSDKNLIQNVLDCWIVGAKNGEIVQWIVIVWLAAKAKLLLVGLNKCLFFISQPLKQHYCFSEWHFFHIFVQWVHTTTTSTFANHPINYEPSVAVRQMHWQLNEMLCCCWSRWIFEVGLENGVSNCLKITNLEHCDMCVTFSVCNMV